MNQSRTNSSTSSSVTSSPVSSNGSSSNSSPPFDQQSVSSSTSSSMSQGEQHPTFMPYHSHHHQHQHSVSNPNLFHHMSHLPSSSIYNSNSFYNRPGQLANPGYSSSNGLFQPYMDNLKSSGNDSPNEYPLSYNHSAQVLPTSQQNQHYFFPPTPGSYLQIPLACSKD